MFSHVNTLACLSCGNRILHEGSRVDGHWVWCVCFLLTVHSVLPSVQVECSGGQAAAGERSCDSWLAVRVESPLGGFKHGIFSCCRFRISRVLYRALPYCQGNYSFLHIAVQNHPKAMIIIIVSSNSISWHSMDCN